MKMHFRNNLKRFLIIPILLVSLCMGLIKCKDPSAKISANLEAGFITPPESAKPRIDNPVSWTKVESDQWVSDGTPQELASNLSNALQWIKKIKSTVKAKTVLMYAWNEFDEGGWICPTLGNNTSRLETVKAVLKK